MKLKCVFSDKDIKINMGLGQCLDKKEVIPYISTFATLDILFSYRNALCSWWSLFCYVAWLQCHSHSRSNVNT